MIFFGIIVLGVSIGALSIFGAVGGYDKHGLK